MKNAGWYVLNMEHLIMVRLFIQVSIEIAVRQGIDSHNSTLKYRLVFIVPNKFYISLSDPYQTGNMKTKTAHEVFDF